MNSKYWRITAIGFLLISIFPNLVGFPIAAVPVSASTSADVPAELSAEGITGHEWESIQEQISAAQYYFTRYETTDSMGYRAPNPAMDLGILVSDTEMTFQNQKELTLSLLSWDGTEISGSMLHENAAQVQRQSTGLTETIINQPDGIGYQVLIESRAQGSQASLHYNASGEMQTTTSGDNLIILDSKGAPAIRISELKVVDAAGHVLTSHFTAGDRQMDLWISNLENAVYPLNIMLRLHTENKTLIHPSPSNYDFFGYSVGVSGDVIVIGAYGQDDGGDMSGAAYVFHRMQGGSDLWGQVQKLTASDASAGDYFGYSVGVSEDVIAIGAYGDDDAGSDSGAVYVFQRMKDGGDQWGEAKKLTAEDPEANDYLGKSVAVDGDIVVAGAEGEDTKGLSAGAVYIFHRYEGGVDFWNQLIKITAPDAEAGDSFGNSVAIYGGNVVVGAWHESSGGPDAGAAYVFHRFNTFTSWDKVYKLTASDAQTGDFFGASVAISGDVIVVGAYQEDSAGTNAGAAYVFNRCGDGAGSQWDEVKKLTASDAGNEDNFGVAVAVAGDLITVGANHEDELGENAGSAYVYHRKDGGADAWGEVQKLTGSNTGAGDNFGSAVDMSEDTILVGADKNSTYGTQAGGAYLFHDEIRNWLEFSEVDNEGGTGEDNFGFAVAMSGDVLAVGAKSHDIAPGSEDMGAVYMFLRTAGGADNWGLVNKLLPPCGWGGQQFGYSVAISGDVLAVGAPYADSKDVNAGVVYIFQHSDITSWDNITSVTASDGQVDDNFGVSVALSGDVLVVGAPYEDDYGIDSGAAYIYHDRYGGSDYWGQAKKLKAPDGDAYDHFGWSVGVWGDVVTVGSPDSNGSFTNTGSVYVYHRMKDGGDTWGQVQKLTAGDAEAGDLLGYAVSVWGDVIVAGASHSDGGALDSGAAYIFQRMQSGTDTWGQVQKLIASDAEEMDHFGSSVSVWGDTAVISAPTEDSQGADAGAAYVFQRTQGGTDQWGEVQKLLPSSNISAGDSFGSSTAISGDVIVVGAYLDDTNGTDTGLAVIFNTAEQSDMTIGKTAEPSPVRVNDYMNYTLSVENLGPDEAENVSVTDTLPAEVIYIDASGTGWACTKAGSVVTCTRDSLAVGTAPDITINVQVPGSTGTLQNTAMVSISNYDGVSSNNEAQIETRIVEEADLSIDKTASSDTVLTGGTLTYTLSVVNLGPYTAEDITVTDTLPTGVSFQSVSGADWVCNENSGVVTCTLGSLAVGDAPDITIEITAPNTSGGIKNTASVSTISIDKYVENDIDTIDTKVIGQADLAIEKSASPSPVLTGGTLTYTLSIENLGPNTATGVTVTDTLPGGVTYQTASGTGWTCGESGGVVTCTLSSLAVGDAPDITILVTAPSVAGVIQNTASVDTNSFDGVSTNNEDSLDTSISGQSDLALNIIASPDPVLTVETLTYTISVENLGPNTAEDVDVIDTLPADVTFQSASGTGWACGENSGVVTCTRSSLAVGDAPDITILVTAPTFPTSIMNAVEVTTTSMDNNLTNNEDSCWVTVNSRWFFFFIPLLMN